MLGSRAGGTNALHAIAMALVVVVSAFVVGYVVFDLEGSIVPTEKHPDVSFRFAYDEAADELVVTHYGGENLDPERVVVLNQGFEVVGAWPATEKVSAGDATTIPSVTETDTIYVMWKTTDGTFVTLATWNDQASSTPRTERIEPARLRPNLT